MSRLDNDKQSFKSVPRKIKVFFHRRQWKETLIFLAFLLMAFGFWYLQSLQEEYEIEISIPVRYKNAPVEISFTDTVPTKITARIKDKGSVLLNYTVGPKFPPFEINLKELPVENGTFVVERKDIEAEIYRQLLASTTLLGVEPGQINLNYSQRMEKDIPVFFNGDVYLAPGFHRSGEMFIAPATVKVYAGQTLLDTLQEVRTVYSEIKKANKTIVRSFPLQKIEGASFQPDFVTITIPIEEYTDKTLEVPVVLTNVPDDFIVRLFPPTVKVVSRVPMSRFRDLSEDQFSVRLSFTDLEENLTGVVSLQISEQPDWVRSATLSPNKIEFILEQRREEND